MTEARSFDVGAAPAPNPPSPELRPTWVLVAVGAVTLAVLTLASVAWIDLHDDVWRAAASCSASFDAPRAVRRLVSLGAAGGFAGLAAAGVWLGVRPVARPARLVFWSAVAVGWLTVIGVAVFGGTLITDCSVAL